jgi:DNA-binding GntR family transcriptional regulator
MTGLERPVRAGALRSQVVGILENAIFYGKLQPGAMLRALPLARKLQVSQSTVREALAGLEQYGLVVRNGSRGTMVARLSAHEIRQRMKVRLALEGLAFAEACTLLGPVDFSQFVQLAGAITSSIASGAYLEAA